MTEHIKNILKKTALAMLDICIVFPRAVGMLIFCKLVEWIRGEEE